MRPETRRGRARIRLLVVASLLCAGCEGVQSALDPRSGQAHSIAVLWWVLLAVCSVVFVIVMALVAWAVARRPRDGSGDGLSPAASRNLVVVGGLAIPIVILFGLIFYSVWVDEKITAEPNELPVTVEVIGHQFWWEVNYLGQDGAPVVVTANEIHIPVSVPVRFILKSADVIHSFWVPNLRGKTDLIPGQINHSWFQADTAGVFRGQCAEFCGLQHAHMAFLVVVEPPDKYAAWLERQRRPAATPADPLAAQGQEIFLSRSCVLCHAVRGTPATGRVGPDLTHVGSRRTIGAATREQTRENLRNWVADPNTIKPGILMPPAHYWFPKMYGRMLDERLGKWSFWLLFIGFNLTFFPMHYLGLIGMPRRVYTYLPGLGWGGLNVVATAGAFVMALSVLITTYNFFRSLKRGEVAGNNPWGADTLEWATESPVPVYNFRRLPISAKLSRKFFDIK